MQLRNCASTQAAVSIPSRTQPALHGAVQPPARERHPLRPLQFQVHRVFYPIRQQREDRPGDDGRPEHRAIAGLRQPAFRLRQATADESAFGRVHPMAGSSGAACWDALAAPSAAPDSRLPTPEIRSRTSKYIASAESHGPSSRTALVTGRIGAPAASSGVATSPWSSTASENASTRVAGWKIGGSSNRDGCVVSASAIHDSRHMLNSVSGWCRAHGSANGPAAATGRSTISAANSSADTHPLPQGGHPESCWSAHAREQGTISRMSSTRRAFLQQSLIAPVATAGLAAQSAPASAFGDDGQSAQAAPAPAWRRRRRRRPRVGYLGSNRRRHRRRVAGGARPEGEARSAPARSAWLPGRDGRGPRRRRHGDVHRPWRGGGARAARRLGLRAPAAAPRLRRASRATRRSCSATATSPRCCCRCMPRAASSPFTA